MSYNLFLDDERIPKDVKWVRLPESAWVIVRNYRQFFDTIVERGIPLMASFDHDLQDFDSCGEEWTGYDCLSMLLKECDYNQSDLPTCYFHTMNVVAKKRMQELYEDYKEHLKKQDDFIEPMM